MPKFNLTKANIATWRQPGPAGFWSWVADVKPRILTRKGQYEVFTKDMATASQIKAVDGMLSPGKHLSCLTWPRRHGKTTLLALLLLKRLTVQPNFCAGLLGASETHVRRVLFNLITRIIRNSPILADSIPESDCRRWDITFKPLDSRIQIQAQNESSAYGDRLDLLVVVDLHSHSDLAPYRQLQASLLDSEGSQLWIDSNIDHHGGPVAQIEESARTDKAIFFSRISYDNFEEYSQKAPSWIDRGRAFRLTTTTLEADYKRDLYGQRSNLKNSLFPPEIIARCRDTYRMPVEDISAITHGRAFRTAGGLDRARSLFQSATSDATVWTSILKCSTKDRGEAEYFVLSQKKISPNVSRLIKKEILKDYKRYHLTNTVLENHEVGDLVPFLSDQGVPHELVNPMAATQNVAFTELFRIAKEGRLHLPANATELIDEMGHFQYKAAGGQKYQFGAVSGKHDDFLYSLCWSVHALRSEILNLYTIGNVQCLSKSPHRSACFLMGGNPGRVLVLLRALRALLAS